MCLVSTRIWPKTRQPTIPQDMSAKGRKLTAESQRILNELSGSGRHAERASILQIAADCPPSPATVLYNICKANERENHQCKPQFGCPRKTTNRDDRRLVREAIEKGRKGRRQTFAEINQNVVPYYNKGSS